MKNIFIGVILLIVIIALFVFVAFLNQSIICNTPYIRVGNGCCLDTNDNRICDSDESTIYQTTTTTSVTTISTSMTTTSFPISIITTTSITTTTLQPECYLNSDCGINGTEILKNYTCYYNNINRQYIVYRCVNPGTSSAKCVGTEKWERIKICGGYTCIEGKQICKPQSGEKLTDYYLAICKDIPEKEDRDYCYANSAKETYDKILCSKINSTSVKDKCYFEISKEKSDVSACHEIGNYELAGECYYNVAIDKDDEDICDRILDGYWRERCYDKLFKYG